jgi:hypothetical protein
MTRAKDIANIISDANFGGTLDVAGVVTANAGVVVDNITIDGTEIDLSSGDLTLDVAGDIMLDSDSGYVLFKDGGTEHARIFQNNSGDVNIGSQISDKDMKFTGNDGGVAITALTLDMSDGGAATLNNGLTLTDGNLVVASGHGIDFGATANSSGTMSSELLDDYEEGTWTPSHGGNTSYTNRTGTYVKVGQTVFIRGQVNINELGTGSNAAITGLPFTSATTVNGNPAGTLNVNYYSGLAIAVIHIAGYVTSNATTINTVANVTANATIEYNTGAFYQDDSRIDFSMTYETA